MNGKINALYEKIKTLKTAVEKCDELNNAGKVREFTAKAWEEINTAKYAQDTESKTAAMFRAMTAMLEVKSWMDYKPQGVQ